MEEEFYATIKLVSGEEIFSKVCPCTEENRIILILDNPVVIETITMRHTGMKALKVDPWMKYTEDEMFIVNMDKVITMTEVNDKMFIKIYQKYLKDKDKKSGRSEISPNMGYVSSVADARISLEKLYKSNS
jgi:hypothetical protein